MFGLLLLAVLRCVSSVATSRVTLGTYLLDVTKLTAVAAERDTTILNEPGGCKTLEVLILVLRPAHSHLRTARLLGKLDGENELTFRVADHVHNSHVDGDVLLEGDEKDGKLIFAKSGLDIREGEIVYDGAGVSLEAGTEAVQIFLLGCIDELGPGLLSLELRNTGPVDNATLLTLKSLVAFLVAKLALHGVGWAAACSMSLDTAGVAGTSELALDARIGAISLVVTDLAAVVAFASEAASGWCVGAFASEMTFLAAAAKNVSMVSERMVANI